MTKYPQIIATIFIVVLFNSCIKQLESPTKVVTKGSEIPLPLVNSDISFLDIKKPTDSLLSIEVNEDSGYYEMVLGPIDFDFPELGTIINLAKNGISQSNVLSFPIANGPTNLPLLSGSIPLDLAQGDKLISKSSLRQITFEGGELGLNLTSTLTNTVNVSVTLLGVINIASNLPVVFTYNLTKDVQQSRNVDLNGHKLVLNGTTALGLSLKVSVNNAIAVPNTFGNLRVDFFGLNNLKWKRIDGKIADVALPLGNDQIELNSVGLTPFNSSDNTTGTGIVFFKNPSMKVNFENSFGIPAKLYIVPFISLDKDSIVLANRTSSPDNLPFTLVKPSDPNVSSIGFPSTSTGVISPNILRDLLNKGPKFLSFGLVLSISGAQTNFDSDFILSKSQIKTKTKITLPLNGYLKDFKINTTIKAPDFGLFNSSVSGDNYSLTLNKSVVHFDFDNKFPLEILLKIDFLDADSIAIPGIGSTVSVLGAVLDANGGVVSSKLAKNNIKLSKQQFEDLKNQCKTIRISGEFNTAGAKDATAKSVKFYPTNSLNIKMSIYMNADAEYDLE